MPVAIDREVVLLGRRRTDDRVRVYSANLGQQVQFSVEDALALRKDAAAPWSDYVRGVVWALAQGGHRTGGFDAVLRGNIPLGAGLSSSAALQVGVAVLLRHLFQLDLEPAEAAAIARHSENGFVGVRSGIMDPFAAAMGRRDHGLLLDCRTLEHRLVPLPGGRVRLVVADTGVDRQLAGSQYNVRREQCETGVALLKRFLPDITALRDVYAEQLARYEAHLPSVIARRCRHVVSENARVPAAAEALIAGDFAACGRLMNESHESLRTDYEVSCDELDEMAAIARAVPGVYGSRMTGAGFGGCVVILVKADAVDELVARIEAEYPRRTGHRPSVYVVAPADGVSAVPRPGSPRST